MSSSKQVSVAMPPVGTSLGTSVLKSVLYVLAFIVPPLLVGYSLLMQAGAALLAPPKQDYDESVPHRPLHDRSKPTVAVLASNEGTEITDFLAPYEVFAASGAFNVYAVAPQRKFTPFMWGGVDLIPHYSFAELDELLGTNPDVIVIPYIKNPKDAEIVQWIQQHAGEKTLVISICGGAHTLAATGLVDSGKVTTHSSYFALLEKEFPHVQLVRDVRYTDNGNTITSAGITAGIDASLYGIQKLLGKQAALDVAAKLHYPHARFLDAPAYKLPASKQMIEVGYLNAAFHLDKAAYGVYLYEGVGEIDLTALLDTYGRAFTARTTTFAEERKVIHSRYALNLVPRQDFAGAPHFDRVLVPGDLSAPVQHLVTWVESTRQPPVEFLYSHEIIRRIAQRFAFDATLTDLALRSSKEDAHYSAKTLEYPTEHLELAGKRWPLQRMILGLAAGAMGLGIAYSVEKGWQRRRRAKAQVAQMREMAPSAI